jgi:ornithine cyclodeaminase/alanine dehydrogenase-like protein (mu-crystallin family)
MLVLRREDIISLLSDLTLDQCLQLLHILWQTLAEFSAGNSSGEPVIHQPVRDQIVTRQGHTTLFMPASDTTTTTGIKIVTLPNSGGSPRGAINVFSPDGELLGLLNAEEITAFRTALSTMIPFKRHALPHKASIAVFGAGKQAEWHIRLALLLAPEKVAKITILNRGRQNLEKLNRRVVNELHTMHPEVRFELLAKEDTPDFDGKLSQRMYDSDAIFCCTTATKPLFPSSCLEPKHGERGKIRFISLIGSYKPHMQEVEAMTLLCGKKILVDSKEACLREAGEIIQAGVHQDQLTEIGELYAQATGEEATKDFRGCNTVFKCVGMGIMDIVIGRELLNMATENGIGLRVDRF